MPDARLQKCGNESGNGTCTSPLCPCSYAPSLLANSLILLVSTECEDGTLPLSYAPTACGFVIVTNRAGPFSNVCHGIDVLAGSYDLRVGPVRGEVLPIAGNKVMSMRGLSALDKNVVIGIGTSMNPSERLYPTSVFPNGTKSVLDGGFGMVKLWTPNDFFVFGINIAAHAKLRRSSCDCH